MGRLTLKGVILPSARPSMLTLAPDGNDVTLSVPFSSAAAIVATRSIITANTDFVALTLPSIATVQYRETWPGALPKSRFGTCTSGEDVARVGAGAALVNTRITNVIGYL